MCDDYQTLLLALDCRPKKQFTEVRTYVHVFIKVGATSVILCLQSPAIWPPLLYARLYASCLHTHTHTHKCHKTMINCCRWREKWNRYFIRDSTTAVTYEVLGFRVQNVVHLLVFIISVSDAKAVGNFWNWLILLYEFVIRCDRLDRRDTRCF
jgi:hypothetical protein